MQVRIGVLVIARAREVLVLAGAGKVALALDTVVDHDGLLEELRVLLEDEVVHGLLADRCRRQPFH